MINNRGRGVPSIAALWTIQLVSNKPVETFIYVANLAKKNIYVGTPDRKIWVVNNHRMRVDTSKPTNKTEAGAAHKAFDR